MYSIYSTASSNNSIIDSIFSNASFDSTSNVFVKWSLNLNVQAIGGTPDNVLITLKDKNNNVVAIDTTNLNGLIPTKILTEYLWNSTGKTYFTLYNVTGQKNGITNSDQLNIAAPLSYTFVMKFCVDNDGDGYGAEGFTSGCTYAQVDCSDNNANINPSVQEICNGIDDNCANGIDENLGQTTCGQGICMHTIDNCVAGQIQTCDPMQGAQQDNNCNGIDDDCDGTADEHYASIASCFLPGICSLSNTPSSCVNGIETACSTGTPSAELCDIQVQDENCNGAQNENCMCIEGDTQSCGPETETGECQFGTQTCNINGQWGECAGAVYPATEICDGNDNDCDGTVDNGFDVGEICSNGIGACERTGQKVCADESSTVCNAVSGTPAAEACNNIDDNCNGFTDEYLTTTDDCSQFGICLGSIKTCSYGFWSESCSILPQSELCPDNLVDNNCDGTDGFDCTACDNDHDGYRNPNSDINLCAGYPAALDCNDADALINPAATETCDGADNNCNGLIDEGFDLDHDNFTICAGDCNDNNDLINPSAQEICNGIDDNCNSQTDEEVMTNYYQDTDGDGYGNINSQIQSCSLQEGYSITSDDCNDGNAAINPGAVEIACDGIDNDCSGTDFEGTDADHDGYKTEGGFCGAIDCNDNNANNFPGNQETCDGIDNNCNNLIDSADSGLFLESCEKQDGVCSGSSHAAGQCVDGAWQECSGLNYGQNYNSQEMCPDDSIDNNCDGENTFNCNAICDADGDGYKPADAQWFCLWPFYKSGDCNDNNALINPGAVETCDGIDNDCSAETADGINEPWYNQITSCGIGECQNTGLFTCSNGAKADTCIEGTPAPETCDNKDNNCDGTVDEIIRDCSLNNQGICGEGTQTCITGDWSSCPLPRTELCNGLDDNCNGQTDEDKKLQFIFNQWQNWGKKGDIDQYGIAPYIYADNIAGSPFASGAFVPINAQYVTTNKNVAGLSLDSGNGYFDVWLYGKHDGIQKEAVNVTLYLDGVVVNSIQNLQGAAYEKARDGKAKFGNAGQDQVWVQAGNKISFIATVTNGNDAFRVYYTKVSCINNDADHDSIPDYLDMCQNSISDAGIILNAQKYADVNNNGVFETKTKQGKNGVIVPSIYDLQDTIGCTCRDILASKPGKDNAQYENGCTKGTIENWIEIKGWAKIKK